DLLREFDDARAARELVAARRALHDFAPRVERARSAHERAVAEAGSTQRAVERGGVLRRRGDRDERGGFRRRAHHRSATWKARSVQLSAAPRAMAKGKMNAGIARRVWRPRSRTIMKKFAIQGMNSVMTTPATPPGPGSSRPASAMWYRPAAPKSRRRN